MVLIIIGSVCGIVLLWFIITYNRFIKGKNMLKEAWSGIDVQLKRRYDLIPNLVETVRGYGKHEKELFEQIAAQRSRCMSAEGPAEKAKAEGMLTESLRRLIAVAEAYPQLRASENYLDLQKNLSGIEDQIQLARRYYNGNARNFNILVEQFPTVIVGRMFNYKTAEFFEVETATERQAPQVKF